MTSLDFLSVLLIAIALSADCFAVALGGSISVKQPSFSQVFRLSLFFGVFQALMAALGWFAGSTIVNLISGYVYWLAFAFLAFVGARMIWESLRSKDGNHKNADITRGFLLLTLSIATSIDALAVGLSFAFLKVNIVLASSTIGTVAFIVTAFGFAIGNKVGSLIGKRAETIGGLVLIGIGIRIVVEHVW